MSNSVWNIVSEAGASSESTVNSISREEIAQLHHQQGSHNIDNEEGSTEPSLYRKERSRFAKLQVGMQTCLSLRGILTADYVKSSMTLDELNFVQNGTITMTVVYKDDDYCIMHNKWFESYIVFTSSHFNMFTVKNPKDLHWDGSNMHMLETYEVRLFQFIQTTLKTATRSLTNDQFQDILSGDLMLVKSSKRSHKLVKKMDFQRNFAQNTNNLNILQASFNV